MVAEETSQGQIPLFPWFCFILKIKESPTMYLGISLYFQKSFYFIGEKENFEFHQPDTW